MKEKKQHDGSGLMIFLVAAIAAVAAAFIIVGLLFFSEEENIQTQESLTSASEPAMKPVTAAGTTTAEVKTSTESTALTLKESETAEFTETTSDTGTEAAASSTKAEITAETQASSVAETAAPAETTASSADTTAAEDFIYDLSYFSNDLFIGDSIYTGLYLYEFFPENRVFAKMGMNPESVRTTSLNGFTAKERAADMKPSRIFIMLGSNGLAYMSASYMADNIKEFVGELLAASPESKIYVVSIPPVTYAHEQKGQETMDMVNKYNSLLESAAAESGAVFLDLCAQLKDESGYFSSKYAEADGMHFLGAGYKLMLGYFYKQTSSFAD